MARAEGQDNVLAEERFVLNQRINALQEQIDGMAAQQAAVEPQLEVVRDEAAWKKGLLGSDGPFGRHSLAAK